MPYKSKKEQAEFMKQYRTPYMKEYRKFKSDQQKKLKEAIDGNKLNLAKQIMNTKPKIFAQTWQDRRDVTMKGSKMFSFITIPNWNPLCMRCQYDCSYCWSEALKDGRLKNSPRYQKLASNGNTCYLVEKELNRYFKAGDFVFVEDCGDLFGDWIGDLAIYKILQVIKGSPDAKFLLLTKNPWRYLAFEKNIPENCLCGCTIETTKTMKDFSKAPAPQTRYMAMRQLDHPHKMICIEPIVDFEPVKFLCWIEEIKPELIVIGYNNYPRSCQLPEPSLAKTQRLIDSLRHEDFNVQIKTLREKYD